MFNGTNGIEIMLLRLGARVQCIDGALGELHDIVIRPRDRCVTHLVVAPRHHHSDARLVPIELATAHTDTHGEIEAECTREVALALPPTEDFARSTKTRTCPCFTTASLLARVEVRHEGDVTAADGAWIGHLESLTIDARAAITAMTFERGRLWPRRRVTVPTSALAKVTMDGLTLALSKPQIAALEPAGRAAAL